MLTTQWLGSPIITSPLFIVTLLKQHIYFPVLASSLLVLGIGIIFWCWQQQGIKRAYALCAIVLMCVMVVFAILTVMLYSVMAFQQTFLNPFLLYQLWLLATMKQKILLSLLGMGITSGTITLIVIVLSLEDKENSRFQQFWQLMKNKHFHPHGFVVGLYHAIKVYVGAVALLVVKPTQGGKTSSIAIPNLIEHTQSLCVNDYKGELYKLTAKFRENYCRNQVYRWAPFANDQDKTHGYNPFVYVRWEAAHAVDDLSIISYTLINETPSVEASIWKDTSREVFKAVALFLYLDYRDPHEVTLRRIIDICCNGSLHEKLSEIYKNLDDHPLSYAMRLFIAKLVNLTDERTRDNLMLSVQHHLAKLFSPKVLTATDSNNFDLGDMRKIKMTVYLEIPDAHKETLLPYITLFYRQFFDCMTRAGEPNKAFEPYSILCILDEFGNMDKIEQLATGVTSLASYGFRFIFMVQNIGQIYAKYGKLAAESFLSAGVKLCGATNSEHDTKHFSQAVGTKIKKKKQSNNYTQEQQKSLLTPDQIRKFPKNKWLVVPEGEEAFIVKQLRWFDDKRYLKILNNKC